MREKELIVQVIVRDCATLRRTKYFRSNSLFKHREHTLLLNRKRVNKEMKRTNSLPLSPVVLTRSWYRENRYLQVLRSIVALNSYLGLSALCKKTSARSSSPPSPTRAF